MELPASIPKERAVKIAERFHAQLFMTPARIIVKQRDDNPNEAVLLVTRSKLTDKYVDTLREEGYSIGTDERVVQYCLNSAIVIIKYSGLSPSITGCWISVCVR